jgi:hypothetical protein
LNLAGRLEEFRLLCLLSAGGKPTTKRNRNSTSFDWRAPTPVDEIVNYRLDLLPSGAHLKEVKLAFVMQG